MNYIAQPNSFTCGPIALYNLLISLNIKCSFKELVKLCQCYDENGTNINDFNNTITKINNKYRIDIKQITPTIDNIDNILLNNGIVILLYHYIIMMIIIKEVNIMF